MSLDVAICGGGITGLTAAYRLAKAGAKVELFEASSRLGGSILTLRRDGFVFDGGPDAFVTAKPELAELAREVGLADRLIETQPASRGIYFLKKGALHRLPEGVALAVPTRFWPLMSSPLFSKLGVLRMGLDVLVPRKDTPDDESITEFLKRRLGQESVELFGEPLLASIYSGDPSQLSMRATFPQLLALEKAHGSLVLGALAARAKAKRGPAPSVFRSFTTGMAEIVEALEARILELGGVVHRERPALAIERSGARVRVLAGEHAVDADHVVLALPAPRAAELLDPHARDVGRNLRRIPHVSTAACHLAFRREDVPHPMDAAGALFLRSEGRDASALTFMSSKWAGRAPEGTALLRVFFGGYAHPEVRTMSSEDLLLAARRELRDVLRVEAPPLTSEVFRWSECRPQPVRGHLARLDEVRASLRALGNVWLCGGPYDGVGLPDCVRQANSVARDITAASPAAAAP